MKGTPMMRWAKLPPTAQLAPELKSELFGNWPPAVTASSLLWARAESERKRQVAPIRRQGFRKDMECSSPLRCGSGEAALRYELTAFDFMASNHCPRAYGSLECAGPENRSSRHALARAQALWIASLMDRKYWLSFSIVRTFYLL